ncbi:permease [Candidatus Magnetomorum sp. HK-1]|nr:permease [Candidatus Magnetomorum sp. HK-1]
MKERTKLIYLILIYLACYYIPWQSEIIRTSGLEAFLMLQEYAREHVLTCLIPAFFIAGAISVFISQASVLKYFGPQAKRVLSYAVASVSGTILAVCSCTVLPLFAGIYTRGAGIGPATAFLYSGPAINVLAIVLTSRILGWELGLARAIGAIISAIVVGLVMSKIFYKDEQNRAAGQLYFPDASEQSRTLFQDGMFLLTLVLILIFAAFAKPSEESAGLWLFIFSLKWYITIALLIVLGVMIFNWFKKDECISWFDSTWGFMKQIFPLLFIGVLFAGFMLGRPGHPALIPEEYIQKMLGGNSFWANFFASISGAMMYFATLTEIPILQGLLGAGMGKGPALALLLSGPALSLPNMLVINGVIGPKKTLVFILTIVTLSTIAGLIYGMIAG